MRLRARDPQGQEELPDAMAILHAKLW